MGRVTHQTTAAPPPSLPIKHFSHPHDLHPLPSNYPQNLAGLCSACKLPSSGMMYTCPPCNFILHQSCAQLPKLITHPAHGGCNLSLITKSSYPGGLFSCDACSRFGDGWSYHCSHCSYDLHVRCSIKPLKIRHRAHPCDLNLTFQTPYANSKGFSCDICRLIGEKQWLYRCDSCQFDVHMDCTASQLQILQHHHALPSSNTSHYHSQLMHSASTGGIPSHHGFNQFQGPVNPGGFNGPVPSNQHLMQNNQQPIGGGFGSNLLMAAMGGVVEGVMQQVAVTAVQEVIGAGDVGGGDAGASSGDVSSY
ncbi:protein VACUOLELESS GAMETOPHYTES-like [Primulina eburnea]|uniref:protein VACUOLELESS GAMETOPHYTES-like n=1 Tax=Primulina eburnea TaxID=1245227 RepID=UPI003C6BFBC5